jgi:hypothetical protein
MVLGSVEPSLESGQNKKGAVAEKKLFLKDKRNRQWEKMRETRRK